jgi:four helix bundle protein
MATIKRFEEMEAWQKARRLCKEIYSATNVSPFSKDFELKNQIRASSGSIMDNIAEGFERGGRKEFIQFLGISKGSCGEVKSQLYRAFDNNYIKQEKFNTLFVLADDVSKMIAGLIQYLNGSTIKGQKYKQ